MAGDRTTTALLGLKLFESDAGTIEAAAERRIAALRKIDPAAHEEVHGRVLGEVEAARQTLWDSAQKQRYDESLRRQAQLRRAQRAAEDDTREKSASILPGPAVSI